MCERTFTIIQCYIITVFLYEECCMYIDECSNIYNQLCTAPLSSICTALQLLCTRSIELVTNTNYTIWNIKFLVAEK